MKILSALIVAMALTGCAIKEPTPEPVQTPEVKPINMVDLNQPIPTPDFSLEFDWQYELQEKYGAIAFNALFLCGNKFDDMLINIDMSSDYGSSVWSDYNLKVRECSENSLSDYPVVPETMRHKIPKDEPVQPQPKPVAAKPTKVETREQELNLEPFEELPGFAPDVNSPRYKKLKKVCSENNSAIIDKIEFESAVEFCVRKSM